MAGVAGVRAAVRRGSAARDAVAWLLWMAGSGFLVGLCVYVGDRILGGDAITSGAVLLLCVVAGPSVLQGLCLQQSHRGLGWRATSVVLVVGHWLVALSLLGYWLVGLALVPTGVAMIAAHLLYGWESAER